MKHDDTPKAMMSYADDLVFEMRMEAGSNDMDAIVRIVTNMNELVQDATRIDREYEGSSDNAVMALSYILDAQETLTKNIAGVDRNNQSRTAVEAKAYRKRRDEDDMAA